MMLAQMLIIVGILTALFITGLRMRKANLSWQAFMLYGALAVFLGFFMAHLCYCLSQFNKALYDMPSGAFFRFWDGNYMLYGGMAGCALAALITAKCARTSALKLMDLAVPGGALMIAFVRISQGVSGNGYGDYLDASSPFARFPFAIIELHYEEWVWALFIPAALYALLLFIISLIQKSRFPGDGVLRFIGFYAAGQILLESLRRDDFLRWGFVRCSQVISAVLVVMVLFCYARYARERHLTPKALCWVICSALIGLCLLLEFAVEQRIPFLLFLAPRDCYWVMACACLGLLGTLEWMRSLSRH